MTVASATSHHGDVEGGHQKRAELERRVDRFRPVARRAVLHPSDASGGGGRVPQQRRYAVGGVEGFSCANQGSVDRDRDER